MGGGQSIVNREEQNVEGTEEIGEQSSKASAILDDNHHGSGDKNVDIAAFGEVEDFKSHHEQNDHDCHHGCHRHRPAFRASTPTMPILAVRAITVNMKIAGMSINGKTASKCFTTYIFPPICLF